MISDRKTNANQIDKSKNIESEIARERGQPPGNIGEHNFIDEMDLSDDWLQLQKDWQNYQPNIKKIKRKISWVTLRMIALLAIDVIVALAYIPFLYFYVTSTDDPLVVRVGPFFMYPVLLYGVYLDFKLRMPVFRCEGESTRDILEFYLRRVQAGVQIGHWGFYFTLMLCGLFGLWFLAGFLLDSGDAHHFSIQSILIAYGVLLTTAVGTYWYRNKKRAEAEELKRLWREFLD